MTLDESRVVVRVPALGDGTEGVIRFHKQVGQSVARDEPVAEIETDKMIVELVAPDEGVIDSLIVEDGAVVTDDAALYVLRRGGAPGPGSFVPPRREQPQLSAATLRWDVGHVRARARGLAPEPIAEAALILIALARTLAGVPGLLRHDGAPATSWVDVIDGAPRWVCTKLPLDLEWTGALALLRGELPAEPRGFGAQLRVLRLHDGAASSVRLARSSALQLVIGPVRDEPVVIAGVVVVRPMATITVESASSGELLRFVAALAEQLARV